MTQEGGDEDLARQLQPHLSNPAAQHDLSTAHDSDVQVNVGEDFPAHTQTSSSQRATWETFDDDDDDNGNRPAPREKFPGRQPAASEGKNGSRQAARGYNAPAAPNDANPAPEAATTTMATAAAVPPVTYNHRNGVVVVVGGGGDVVNGQGAGGVIQTRNTQLPPTQEGLHDTDRPLRPSRIRMLKILSVAAAVLFFPTGIPAAVLAWRIRGQFEEGLLHGNIDKALKTARRCRHLCLASLVLAVFVAALALGLVERITHGTGDDHSYVAHGLAHGR